MPPEFSIVSAHKPALAVFTPAIGERSETFIRRQIEDLYPGQTVVVTFRMLPQGQAAWQVSCPTRKVADLSFEGRRGGRYLRRVIPRSVVSLYYEKTVLSWLLKRGVTALLGQYLHQSWPFLQLAKKHGIRFYAHAHGYDLSKYWRQARWRYRYSDYENADGVIVVNQVMKERMIEAGVSKRRIHVVPYGVEVSDAGPRHSASNSCRFLAVGRLVGKKAPIALLTAFQRTLERNRNVSLDLVGTGPLWSDVVRFVEASGLQQFVTLHGGRSHEYVLDLMRLSDCFVQHSVVDLETGDEEGVPVAVLEAMANGLPVVSTIHAGIPEVVASGVTGLLVEEGDVAGMADAMTTLSLHTEARINMGEAGRKVVREQFTWEIEKNKLREIIHL